MRYLLVIWRHYLLIESNNLMFDDLRYGQEEPGERLEILQQPLALGYLTSTARTGAMPRW